MMKLLMMFAIVASVVVSGCTGLFGSSSGSSGEVKINSFSFSPDNILEGQSAFLNLEIQNGGTFAAERVTVLLYGLTQDFIIDRKNKIVSSEPNPSETDTAYLTTFSDIYPPSDALGSGGERRSIRWLIEYGGDVLPSQTLVHTAHARVCYNYKTEAKGKIQFISESEYLLQKERGALEEGMSSFESTSGPLHMRVEIPTPIVARKSVPVKVSISNVGSGFAVGTSSNPCTSLDTDVANQARLTVKTSNSLILLNCPEAADGLTVFLKRGDTKSETIFCEYEEPIQGVPEVTEEIDLTLQYGYYTDATSQISVTGAGN